MLRVVNKSKKAVKIYKRDGLRHLYTQTKDFLRDRAVPFYQEIWFRHTLNKIRYGTVPHPLTVFWIKPTRVQQQAQHIQLERRFDIGKIKDGEWDTQSVPITNWSVYRGLKQRFDDGLDWEETEYYRHGCELINETGRAWNCTSPSEFLEQRCQYVDELYDKIKKSGYKRSTELVDRHEDAGRNRDITERHVKTHEISIAIGRNGELMLRQGIHRYCIARLLEIEKIPVQILVRHREWQRIRNTVARTGEVPDGIDRSHPDLQDVLETE